MYGIFKQPCLPQSVAFIRIHLKSHENDHETNAREQKVDKIPTESWEPVGGGRHSWNVLNVLRARLSLPNEKNRETRDEKRKTEQDVETDGKT